MNLPNKLTLLRVLLVPVFVLIMTLGIPYPWSYTIAAAVFLVTALTDMLDGKIARKYGLITDFGKFMDPLADKFMVFAALITLLTVEGFADMRGWILWSTLIVILRELSVTSMRLVVSGMASATKLAANNLGKIKTVSQIVFIMTILLEPVLFGELFPMLPALSFFTVFAEYHILTYATMAFMVLMTVWSGVNYIIGYSQYLEMK